MAAQRNDPTFPIFVVLAAIFIFAVMYLTYPHHEAPVVAASGTAAGTK